MVVVHRLPGFQAKIGGENFARWLSTACLRLTKAPPVAPPPPR
jgi:hypothetical protein